jgi:hemolysin activation/secretion protein
MKNRALLLFVLFLTAFAQSANAQVPSSAEPSRASQNISPIEREKVTPLSSGVVSVAAPIEAPAGAEKVKLTLKSVSIEGATAYSEAEIAALYQDMIGTTITLADVYGIAQRLTVKYRNDGYILTQVIVPEQTISGGNVRLRVVEGFVDNVSVQGDTHGKLEFLQGFANKIRAEKPMNAKKLERYVLLMNDLAGVSAKAVLSPSAKVQGASDIAIMVEQKPVDVFGQVDNRGTRYLGPMQWNAGARINNAFGMYEGLSLQGVTAFTDGTEREMDYFGMSWSQPLNTEGTKLSLGGSLTSTDPGYTLSASDVKGLAKNINLELSHPFIRSRNDNLFGSIKFNYLNSTRKDNLGGGDTTDHLRVLRAAGTYQFTDRFIGINTFNVEASKGLGLFGASDEGDANMTRALGDPRFYKTTLEISRLQRLTDVFDIFVSAAGQKSSNYLLASEEFGVGGINYGSAYDSSEITGEDGVAGRFELRANNLISTPADMLQLYGFYDIGKVWDKDNALPEDRQRSIASTGAGFRTSLNENFAGTFEVALPLTRKVGTESDKEARFFGSLTARF